ncbi:MAG: hypothetical protein GY801_22435 [bacterium]|nr:hypothetical protein [bacterium]
MKTVIKVTAIATLIAASASASAWIGNNSYGAPYGYAPYGYAVPAMTEEQQKAMAGQQKQVAEQHAKAIQAHRQAAEAFAKQQAEAYKLFTANAPQAPLAMPGSHRPGFAGFQSHDEVIRQMEARRAQMEKQFPAPSFRNREEMIKEMDARRAEAEKRFAARSVPGFGSVPADMRSREEAIKEMEAYRAKMQKQMNERRAEFEKAGRNI